MWCSVGNVVRTCVWTGVSGEQLGEEVTLSSSAVQVEEAGDDLGCVVEAGAQDDDDLGGLFGRVIYPTTPTKAQFVVHVGACAAHS